MSIARWAWQHGWNDGAEAAMDLAPSELAVSEQTPSEATVEVQQTMRRAPSESRMAAGHWESPGNGSERRNQ